MSNDGLSLVVAVERIAESNRLLGMMQAIEEVAKYASLPGVTVTHILAHCLYKSSQVVAEHLREFGKGEG